MRKIKHEIKTEENFRYSFLRNHFALLIDVQKEELQLGFMGEEVFPFP